MDFHGLSFTMCVDRSDKKLQRLIELQLLFVQNQIEVEQESLDRDTAKVDRRSFDDAWNEQARKRLASLQDQRERIVAFNEASLPKGVKIWKKEEFHRLVITPIEEDLRRYKLSIYQEETIPFANGTIQWDVDVSGKVEGKEQLLKALADTFQTVGISKHAAIPMFLNGNPESAFRIFVDLTSPESVTDQHNQS